VSEKNLTVKDFDKIIKENDLVLVDFWAAWCGPCQMMEPIVEEITKEVKKVVVGKVNIDKENKLATKFHVMSVPTFLLFKSGEVADQIVGAVSKNELINLIEKNSRK